MVRKYTFIAIILTIAICGVVWSASSGPWGETRSALAQVKAEAGKSPKAVFSERTYQFTSTMEGVDIKHDFYIENHGQAPLVIQKVQPD
jgi:hypothetical protein